MNKNENLLKEVMFKRVIETECIDTFSKSLSIKDEPNNANDYSFISEHFHFKFLRCVMNSEHYSGVWLCCMSKINDQCWQ